MENSEKEVVLHDGVKLLLERMKSHPEEFVGAFAGALPAKDQVTSKWTKVISKFWEVLTPSEQEAIMAGLAVANRHCFHAAVMKTILVGKGEDGYEQTPEQMELPGILTKEQIINKALDNISYNMVGRYKL